MSPISEALADVRAYQRNKQIVDIADALRFIGASSNLFHNGDSLAEDAAIEALQAGREAYWSKSGYSNQRAIRLLSVANKEGLAFALRACADDTASSYGAQTPFLLNTLWPLNKPAMVAHLSAWAEWSA